MKGKELKEIIDRFKKKTGKRSLEIIEESGIAQRSYYDLFDKDEVEQFNLDKLSAIGVPVQKSAAEVYEKRVPYYDIDATAGNVSIFQEDGPEYIKQYITVPAFNDCEMFIGISGNSMYPKYCAGELVALKKIEDFDVVALGEAYMVVTKEQRLLKYIKKGTDKSHWLLASENREYESFEIPIKKVLHLYIVKGKITKNII